MLPEKLHRCVDDLKAKGGVDNPWAVCNASLGKKEASIIKNLPVRPAPYVKDPPKGELNKNRMVPFYNPPLKKGKIEHLPDVLPCRGLDKGAC